ncbi:helix-turn-helix domain-containing protein [Brevundimonas vancanneytii]|uniref:helix-turn-helix domain-containing protein n=1 Tax=Brevundimonas vancanneytii TaxID=1325724 RepID=UPI0010FE95C9|nr:helix-turn-helix transcriptional regulator [Brevundimonas vancanneytii]
MRKWVSSPEYRAAVEVVVTARKAQGLTQREVESRLGKTHHGWLAKIEVGERQMNVIDLIAIARAIGVDERQLFDKLLRSLPAKLDV